MYTIYGFGPGLRWVGDALGLGEAVRGRAASALAACGVAPTRFTDAGDAVEAAVAKVPAPGAGAWDDEVRSLLLIAYDADGSGAVDTLAEVSGIGCGVFVRLDGQLRAAFPKGFAATYGVSGGEWLGESLGFGLATRTALNARVGVCLGSTR
jgi:hypothetical protein